METVGKDKNNPYLFYAVYLGVLTGGTAAGAGLEAGTCPPLVKENGSMESVWKLIGGVGVILSICWIPA